MSTPEPDVAAALKTIEEIGSMLHEGLIEDRETIRNFGGSLLDSCEALRRNGVGES